MIAARRALLALIAVAFAGIAAASLVVPDVMADGLGYALTNVDAKNEFKAIYVGLWLATAVIFARAVRRPDDATLYSVCVLLLGGQLVGRLLSLALDGLPSAKLAPPFVIEAIGVVALIALRPRDPERRAA